MQHNHFIEISDRSTIGYNLKLFNPNFTGSNTTLVIAESKTFKFFESKSYEEFQPNTFLIRTMIYGIRKKNAA